MQINDIIGKTITNMYSLLSMDVDGMDIYECFMELDNSYLIDIPYGLRDEVWLKELKPDAINIFADLSDIQICGFRINYQQNQLSTKKGSIFHWLRKMILGHDIAVENTVSYTREVEYVENKLKYVKDRKIVDLIWYASDYEGYDEEGYLLLDNGYLITITRVSPHGTGTAGLHLFENINKLTNIRGYDYFKLTDKIGCH